MGADLSKDEEDKGGDDNGTIAITFISFFLAFFKRKSVQFSSSAFT